MELCHTPPASCWGYFFAPHLSRRRNAARMGAGAPRGARVEPSHVSIVKWKVWICTELLGCLRAFRTHRGVWREDGKLRARFSMPRFIFFSRTFFISIKGKIKKKDRVQAITEMEFSQQNIPLDWGSFPSSHRLLLHLDHLSKKLKICREKNPKSYWRIWCGGVFIFF